MTEHDETTIDQRGEQDAALVRAYLDGDRSALAAVYDRYGQSLFDTAAAMTSSRDDAADMVQDVFVLAAERLGQLRDQTRLKPWLFAILRNEVYRRSRRRSRNVVTDFSAPERDVMLPPTSAETDAVDDDIDFSEIAEMVRGAARGLDARDQLVLELSVRQGLTGADLADALGVSPQQSYGLVHRMRERTERSLSAYCVARKGRRECTELDAILNGWDGDFTVLLRKRVARHIEECTICERTRRRFAPIALVGAAPAFAAPVELRDRIIERLDLLHPKSTSDTSGFSSSSGFPVLAGTARIGRRVATLLGGTTAAALLAGATLWFGGSGVPPTPTIAPLPSVVVVTTTTIRPATTTTTPATTVPRTTTTIVATTTIPRSTTTITSVTAPPSGKSVTATTLPSVTSTIPSTTTTVTTAPPTTTTTSTTTTTPPTTTLAPAPPVISNAYSGTGLVDLPTECSTKVYVTVEFSDANDDELSLTLNWSSDGTPSSGSTTYPGLRSGSQQFLLGEFDYTHRGSTIYVTMTLSDGNGTPTPRGFQLQTSNGGGNCPSTFG